MKVMFCWWTFQGYLAACWQALARTPGVDLRVVALRPDSGDIAPHDASLLDGVPAELHDVDQLRSVSFWLDRIAAERPDAVVFPGWANPACIRLARHPALDNTAIILTGDRVWSGSLRQRAATLRFPGYFRRADCFVAAGTGAALLARHLGVPDNRIDVGMYGIDNNLFGTSHDARSRGPWPRTFLFAGRYIPEKGVDILARAYREYRTSVPDPWPLHACGRGPLARLLTDSGATDLGFQSPTAMSDIMARSGAFVLPSVFEPWGVVLAEAAAAGLPLICTRLIGSADTVAGPRNALMVPPGDVPALTRALLHVHTIHAHLPAMGAESRRLATPLAATAWAAHWASLLERAIERRARKTALRPVEPGRMTRTAGRIAGSLAAPMTRTRPGCHMLCFHQISHPQRAELLALVDRLTHTHDIVSYSEAVRRSRIGADRPTLALTFDDGTADHALIARDLAVRGVSACFFVCPDLLDAATDVSRTATLCTGALRIPPTSLLGWNALHELVARGHEIGCHTRSHPDLATVSPERLSDEILGARRTIMDRGLTCAHFAWPFGRFARFSPAAAAQVRSAGFASCASAEPGMHAPTRPLNELVCVHRVVVGERESSASIAARLHLNATRRVTNAGWPSSWSVG